MSSSRRAQDHPQQTPAAGLQLTLPVLVTAGVLFVAALVLAYLGGVMTGRAQWASSLEESRAALAAAAATDGQKDDAAGEGQAADADSAAEALAEASVLAASELRFSRALRAEPGARLEPVSPPLPAAQAPRPAAGEAPAYPPMPPGMQPAVPAGEKAPPPTPTDMYDFVFQLGAFRDAGIVDDLPAPGRARPAHPHGAQRQALSGHGGPARHGRAGPRGGGHRPGHASGQAAHAQPQACSRPPLGPAGRGRSRAAGPACNM